MPVQWDNGLQSAFGVLSDDLSANVGGRVFPISERGKMQAKRQYIWDREKQIAKIKKLTLFSDMFLSVALDDVGACQYVLRVILRDEKLRLKWVKTQYVISKLTTHDARLDVLAEGIDGTLYGMEIQNRDNADHPRRVRFYDAMIGSEFLRKGAEFEELPESYMIYICRSDFMKNGTSGGRVGKFWVENKKLPYEDGGHIVYVNAEVDDHSKTSELMSYFKTSDPYDMSQGELSKRVHFLKTEKRGLEIMCEYSEKLWRDGAAYGRRIGERRGEKRGERRGGLREQNKFQKLISAMVQAGETALLPKLGEDRDFVLAMYRKYKI